MRAEKEKEDEIQTIKPKERSETDKAKEEDEFETLEMESTGEVRREAEGKQIIVCCFSLEKNQSLFMFAMLH